MDRHGTLPKLTLAIAAKGMINARPFLTAVAEGRYGTAADVEIILAHDGLERIADAPARIVQLLLPPNYSIFHLWAAAIGEARTDYVAIMDAHSLPSPEWYEAMLDAICGGGSGYFGPVEASYPPGDNRVIGYLVEYVQFHRPIAETLEEIPGNNLIVRRSLISRDADFLRRGFVKSALIDAWRENGTPLPRLVPAAVVGHAKPFDWRRYVVRRFRHGRCYAAGRLEKKPRPPRPWLVLTSPLLPFVRVLRIWRHVRRMPHFRSAFLRYFALILIAESGWSLGEFTGYVAGEGQTGNLLD